MKKFSEARMCLADVYFPSDGRTLTYFNDRFRLKVGDLVFVEGKLEGISGRVRALQYNFRIRPEQYKKILSVADTRVHGKFYLAGSHYVTFDPRVLTYEQAAGWFLPPQGEFITSADHASFRLDDTESMPFTPTVMERGYDYYLQNRVACLSLSGSRGRALVQGSHPYEVEFTCRDGILSRLTCTCPCSCNCKHQFAAVLQLRETLDRIEKNYRQPRDNSDCFMAVSKEVLHSYVLSRRETGSISI